MPGFSNHNQLPVSVVIPTYNGQRYIEEALGSVFAQTQLPSEIIVVDDASTDHTTQIVQTLAADAPIPLRLIRLPHNSGGPARPMNVGIEAAQSPLIAILDQDDVFLPEKIERQAAVLSTHTQLAFVFSYVDVKPEPNRELVKYSPENHSARLQKQMVFTQDHYWCDGSVALRVLINHGNCIGGFPGFMFRRDDWQKIGGIDESIVAAADYDLLCRLCRTGDVALVPEVHYLYRFHDENLSGSRILCYADQIETLAKFAHCGAWPNASSEVRQAIAQNLYRLAILSGTSGSRSIARRLLTTSLRVGGLRPDRLIRAAAYPIKVFRRRRGIVQAKIDSTEFSRSVQSVETANRLFGRPSESDSAKRRAA